MMAIARSSFAPLFALAAILLSLFSPAGAAVTIDSPLADSTWTTTSTITLLARVDGPSSGTLSVEFLANDGGLGSDSAEPYSLAWTPPGRGVYTLVARATSADTSTTDSFPIQISVGFPSRDCLMVVGFLPLIPGDVATAARLETWGYRVIPILAASANTASANGMALIFISESVSSNNVGTKWRDVTIPVFCAEDYNYDEFGMTGLVINTDYGFIPNLTRMTIVEGNSPLAGGLPPGTFDVFTSAGRLQWGIPNANATIAATIENEPTKATIFGYRTGAMMSGGIAAPARRTGFFLQTFTQEMTLLTPAGLELFDAATRWTGGQETDDPPPTPFSIFALTSPEGVSTVTWISNGANPDGFELDASYDFVNFHPLGRFVGNIRTIYHAPAGPAPRSFRVRSWNGNGFSAYAAIAPPPQAEAWQVQ